MELVSLAVSLYLFEAFRIFCVPGHEQQFYLAARACRGGSPPCMSLHYVFPNYTNIPPRSQDGGGDIQALPGTRVQLTMQANVPLRRGVLRFDDGSELPLDIAETTLRGEILVMKEATYVVEVEDTHGSKIYSRHGIPYRFCLTASYREYSWPAEGVEVDETAARQL
jgi:hypothetical protein